MNAAAAQPPWRDPYDALVQRTGLVTLARTQIELSGNDRARFMHNLCTNEVKKLPTGAGCEAFLTSVQGKTLGHGFIIVGPDSLVLDTVAGQSEILLKHLDKYLVSEQVTLADRTGQWAELLLAGPTSEAVLTSLANTPLPHDRLANAVVEIAGTPVWVRRVDITGPDGFLLSVAAEQAPAVAVRCARRVPPSAGSTRLKRRGSNAAFRCSGGISPKRTCRRKSIATRWPSAL